MLKRSLAVSFQQAARAVALTLFPASFISLFAWATAGSQSGNTVDPLRGSVWIWLGAHLVPFHLAISSSRTAGALTILPIGALIFPIWAIRKSFPKVRAALPKIEGARFFFALTYTVIATVLAVLSRSGGITPLWYFVPLFTFPISYIATYDFQASETRYMRFAFHAILLFWGIAGVVMGISLLSHWNVLHDLGVVVAPGFIGGFLFLIIQALYIPNAAFAGLAYLTGVGFHLGAGTSIAATHFTVHGIPAIPLLAALPTGKHENSLFKSRQFFALRTSLLTVLLLAIFSFISSGELLTSQMYPVGVIWWRLASYFAAAFLGVLLLTTYLPALVKRARHNG